MSHIKKVGDLVEWNAQGEKDHGALGIIVKLEWNRAQELLADVYWIDGIICYGYNINRHPGVFNVKVIN